MFRDLKYTHEAIYSHWSLQMTSHWSVSQWSVELTVRVMTEPVQSAVTEY